MCASQENSGSDRRQAWPARALWPAWPPRGVLVSLSEPPRASPATQECPPCAEPCSRSTARRRGQRGHPPPAPRCLNYAFPFGGDFSPPICHFLLEGDSCPSPKFIDSRPNSQHLRWTVRGAWTFKEVIRVNGGRWGEGALTQHDCVLLRRKEDMDAGRTQRAGPREDVGRSQLCGRGGGAGPGPQASGSWALRGRSSVVRAAVWHAITDCRGR